MCMQVRSWSRWRGEEYRGATWHPGDSTGPLNLQEGLELSGFSVSTWVCTGQVQPWIGNHRGEIW